MRFVLNVKCSVCLYDLFCSLFSNLKREGLEERRRSPSNSSLPFLRSFSRKCRGFFFSLFWMKVEPWCFGFCFVCFSKVQTKVPQKFPCTTHRVEFLELLLSDSLLCCVFIFFSSVFFFLFLDGQSVYAISKYYSNISLVEDSKVMKILVDVFQVWQFHLLLIKNNNNNNKHHSINRNPVLYLPWLMLTTHKLTCCWD